jgi:ribosomal protein S25
MKKQPDELLRTHEKVKAALRESKQALDSYQLARATGLTPMIAGRVLVRLAKQGVVRPIDELDTANDLAARYELVALPVDV